MLSADHVFCHDDDKLCIGDGVVGPLVFLLGILELVDVIADSLAFEMVTLHLVLQCEDNEVMNSTTRQLEVDEKLPHGNQGVVGLGPIDFQTHVSLITPRMNLLVSCYAAS